MGEEGTRAKAAGWDLCTWHLPCSLVFAFFSSSRFCSMYIIFCKILSSLGFALCADYWKHCILFQCFFLPCSLVRKITQRGKNNKKKKKIIILHCSLCTIFVDNVLLKGCLFSAPLHWHVFGGHLACFYYSDCKTWDDKTFFFYYYYYLVCNMNFGGRGFFSMFCLLFPGHFNCALPVESRWGGRGGWDGGVS